VTFAKLPALSSAIVTVLFVLYAMVDILL
jgi:hypothetical protein